MDIIVIEGRLIASLEASSSLTVALHNVTVVLLPMLPDAHSIESIIRAAFRRCIGSDRNINRQSEKQYVTLARKKKRANIIRISQSPPSTG